MKFGKILKRTLFGRQLRIVLWSLGIFLLLVNTRSNLFGLEGPIDEELTQLETKIVELVTIGDLIEYAYKNNPSIQEAREAWNATVESYGIATGYPDPELMATYYPNPLETRLGPQDWNANLTQKIPFPGKLSKAGEIVEMEARLAKLNLDKTVRDLIVSIRGSFYELNYIRQARVVAAQNMELLGHLRKIGETAYAQERASLLDTVKGQSQTGQLRYDVLLLEELEKTEIARLNGLLNRYPDATIGKLKPEVHLPIAYSLEEIYKLSKKNQQEIQMTEVEIEKAGKKIELARYENLPDFKVGVFYAGIGSPDVANPPLDAGDDAFGIQTGISLPLWFGKNKSRISRARAEKKKAEAAKTARVTYTQTQIRAFYFRLQNSKRLIALYQNELLPQAAKSMEIAETWFREKQSTFSDFIEAQAVWYNFQLALARAHADYGINITRLERLVGQSITVRNEGSDEKARKGEK